MTSVTDPARQARAPGAALEWMQKDRSTEKGRAAHRLLRRINEGWHSETYTEREDWIAVFADTAAASPPRDGDGVDYAEAARVAFEACRDRFMRAEQCYPIIDALTAAGFIFTQRPREQAAAGEAIIASLTEVQRDAIKGATFLNGEWGLSDRYEDHPDIAECMSEEIADPTSGILTPHGVKIRDCLTAPSTPAASVEGADEWHALSARADQDTGNEGEDMAAIGIRDGYSRAVQTLDVLTGGDGEYGYCTIPSDSHCPDPPAMIRRIMARIHTTAASGEVERDPAARACHFGGISYSNADLAIAQRAACAIVPLYGTGDHGEQEAARAGKLWNDHPAVQGALRALHKGRLAASGAVEAVDRFISDHVGTDDSPDGVEVEERAQKAVAHFRATSATPTDQGKDAKRGGE